MPGDWVYILGIVLACLGLAGVMVSVAEAQVRWGAVMFVGALVLVLWGLRMWSA